MQVTYVSNSLNVVYYINIYDCIYFIFAKCQDKDSEMDKMGHWTKISTLSSTKSLSKMYEPFLLLY